MESRFTRCITRTKSGGWRGMERAGRRRSIHRIKLAEQLVETLHTKFKPEQYHDEFQERMRKLVEAKAKGKKIAVEPPRKKGRIIAIMEALKKSLTRESRIVKPGQKLAPPVSIATGKRRGAGAGAKTHRRK